MVRTIPCPDWRAIRGMHGLHSSWGLPLSFQTHIHRLGLFPFIFTISIRRVDTRSHSKSIIFGGNRTPRYIQTNPVLTKTLFTPFYSVLRTQYRVGSDYLHNLRILKIKKIKPAPGTNPSRRQLDQHSIRSGGI